MNPNLAQLNPYPFERLAKLKEGLTPPARYKPIMWSIGEPQHASPAFVEKAIAENLGGLSKYPLTLGSQELREAIAKWLTRRFKLKTGSISADLHILPVNGTREALFSIAHCLVDSTADALVLMPNPFYQIYEGAALLAGAQPHYINICNQTGQPDFASVSADIWKRCQLLYVCSPGNPTGAVIPQETIAMILGKSEEFGFPVIADECYSEIYFDENKPPLGLLEAQAQLGRHDFRNTLVFHSLSKRSNLPGMRSGFVAGDELLIAKYRQYRTYHGSAMSPPYQAGSLAAWQDEMHVIENRRLYKEKFEAVCRILGEVLEIGMPEAGFYLWPKTPIGDEQFAHELYEKYNLTVLPGSYLSRQAHGTNPGANHVRMALVTSLAESVEAAERIVQFIRTI